MIFNSFGAFANFLITEIDIELTQHVALEKACQMVEDSAKDAIGNYIFDWPHLQPATIARKAQGDTPLLETGELRDSISHVVYPEHGYGDVGSNDPVAKYQELGTSRIPPRSFLGSAARAREHEIVEMIGKMMRDAFLGRTAFSREWREAIHALREAYHAGKKLGHEMLHEHEGER